MVKKTPAKTTKKKVTKAPKAAKKTVRKKTRRKTAKKTVRKPRTTKTTALSSAELYRLAKKKEAEESLEVAKESQKVLAELQKVRQALVNELNKVDSAIGNLGGKASVASVAAPRADKPVKLRGMTGKIYEALKASPEPLGIDEVMKSAGIPEKKKPSVFSTLTILKKKGLVISSGWGKYSAC